MNQLTTYKDRRAFGDSSLDEAKKILADYFCTSVSNIQIASDDLDCKEATDFVVNGSIRVAFRCRSAEYLSLYPNDITIRLDRRSGMSEWQKIQAKTVGYMLYGFVRADGLTAWKLIDLAELLNCLIWVWHDPTELRPVRHCPQGQEPFMSIDLSPLDLNLCLRGSIVIAEG